MKLLSLVLHNFKGIKEQKIDFNGEDLVIYGDNATGKTTIADAFFWLLFDKDSQNKKQFEIKTLDKDGKAIPKLDHSVDGVFETENGTVVILGCAHAGIINTLRHIRRLTKKKPIHTVIGGMHLHSASEDRMKKTVKALRKLDIGCMFLCHCTGFDATAQLWNEFPGKVRPCPTGTIISMTKES